MMRQVHEIGLAVGDLQKLLIDVLAKREDTESHQPLLLHMGSALSTRLKISGRFCGQVPTGLQVTQPSALALGLLPCFRGSGTHRLHKERAGSIQPRTRSSSLRLPASCRRSRRHVGAHSPPTALQTRNRQQYGSPGPSPVMRPLSEHSRLSELQQKVLMLDRISVISALKMKKASRDDRGPTARRQFSSFVKSAPLLVKC